MAKRQISPIRGPRVRLRVLEEADLPMTREWRNQDHIRRWFIYSAVITPEQHWRWFARYAQRDDDFVFVIEETQNLQKPIGQISLYNIEWARGRAEYGRLLIGEAAAGGKGLAREATQLLLAYAFEQLGLKEIELEVFSTNAAAIAIYCSCGFRKISESNGLQKMIKVVR
ncbi:MAG: GNAT family N-acetyltransferase [Deltaproteobacteria bacterium]|nr:GNAT family N-acetyltransferase [Deltaproteobacteria bacterium]